MFDYYVIKTVSASEARNLLGEEPKDFYTYYLHCVGEEQYILRTKLNRLLWVQAI